MALDEIIQRLVENFREAKASAVARGNAAQAVFLEELFRKSLILSSASLFEHRIMREISQHVETSAGGSDCVVALVTHKAIKRQYHTYFNWDEEKLGAFPTLMGDSRGEVLKSEAKVVPTKENTDAFLQLGSLRNQLVHKNFAGFTCEKTSEEVIALCEKAEAFVQRVENLLREIPARR
jgi:hypothetical protein